MLYSQRDFVQTLADESSDELPLTSDAELGDAPEQPAPRYQGVSRVGAAVAAVVVGAAAAFTVHVALNGRPRAIQAASSALADERVSLMEEKAPWDCTDDGDDCRVTQCCSKPGSQCYVKNEYWASCNATCHTGAVAGDKDTKGWACDPLGERAPPACSWEGANCAESKCCRRQGFSCYEREPGYASCEQSCENLKKLSSKPWTCNVLGGSQKLQWVKPSADHAVGSSFFCFTVVTANAIVAPGVKAGYEKELITMMKAQNLSLFGCEASKVYQGAKAAHGDWKSVVNTDIFINVWNQVKKDGTYLKHDWTIKVDADAVFLPSRLKAHLASMKAPKGVPIYLHNIEFRFHFMGALEVMTKEAATLFIQSMYTCESHIAANGGEDFFTMQCLDAMGAAHMTDFSLLDDKYTHGEGWHLFDVNPCTDQSIVAFHPYKAVNSWLGCYKVAMSIQKPTDFVGCDFRWHGDACSLGSKLSHSPSDPQPSDGIMRNRAR